MAQEFERYYTTLTGFAKNADITQGTKKRAFEYLCQEIAKIMEVSVVGIWLYSPNKDSIASACAFERESGIFSSGQELYKKKHPIYFQYLETERLLASENTMIDPVTSELVAEYLQPFNIHALIDAPIYFDGEMVGVLCCEQQGSTRDWTVYDRSFVISCADFIGRVLEADKRREYEKELQHRIFYLEKESQKKLNDLNEAKLNLDLALEGASLAKWDWEIKTGKVVFSETWAERFGFDLDKIEQSIDSFKQRIHPDDFQMVFEALSKHLRGEVPYYEAKFRMIDSKGNQQWVLDRGKVIQRDENGEPVRATGLNLDISTLVGLEESLKQSEEQLKLMIKSIPSAVAMLDKELKFITYSQQWQDDWSFLGTPHVGVSVGKTYPTFVRRDEWEDKFKRVIKGEVITCDEEFIEFENEGRYVWVRWELRPWHKVSGEIGGILLLVENITRRKEAEMKLTQSSKLSALGEMAGGIAHEINNPLGIIRGYVDLIQKSFQRGINNPEVLSSHVDKIGKTVERISKIVTGMRRFSRDSSKDPKVAYSLNQLIDDSLDISQERIKNHGIFLNIEKFPENPVVECKPIEMSQVLLNLLGNSIFAVQSHSKPWVKIVCRETVSAYEIQVIDSGEGLSLDVQKKIFQPFFTTKDIGVGTGLGLSISKAIIEEQGGTLYYDPTSKNTCFVIQFRKASK